MTTPAPLTILARVLLLLASVGAGFWAATREYSIGLDFQGGAFVELAVQQVPPEHGLEAARELLAELEMSGSLRLSGDHVSLQLDGADEADVERIEQSLVAADFQLLPACDATWSTAQPLPDGAKLVYETRSDRVIAHCLQDAPIATGADIVSAEAEPANGAAELVVQFGEAAGLRMHQHTSANIGSVVAIVINHEIAMAPVILEPIPGGRISIDLGSDATLADAERVARQLRAAAFGLEIERSDVIHPVHAPALGRPVPVVLGILGGLAWMFVLLRRRTPWPWLVAAAMATTGAVVEVYSLSRGTTLTAAMHLGMFALALAVGVAVTIGEQRGSRLTIGGRLLAAWPGLIGFVGVFALGLLAAGSPGFWRGVSHTLFVGFGPAVLLAVLGVVALAATDSPNRLQSLELDQMRDGSR